MPLISVCLAMCPQRPCQNRPQFNKLKLSLQVSLAEIWMVLKRHQELQQQYQQQRQYDSNSNITISHRIIATKFKTIQGIKAEFLCGFVRCKWIILGNFSLHAKMPPAIRTDLERGSSFRDPKPDQNQKPVQQFRSIRVYEYTVGKHTSIFRLFSLSSLSNCGDRERWRNIWGYFSRSTDNGKKAS